jgi:general secretion pathway protein G
MQSGKLKFTGRLRGFTLIELLVVLTILALLVTMAAPRYFDRLDKAKESLLKQELQTVRESIDKFYADEGRFPESLEELVEKKYINKMPYDPITEKTDTWVTDAPTGGMEGNVADLHSGALSDAADGSPYASW